MRGISLVLVFFALSACGSLENSKAFSALAEHVIKAPRDAACVEVPEIEPDAGLPGTFQVCYVPDGGR